MRTVAVIGTAPVKGSSNERYCANKGSSSEVLLQRGQRERYRGQVQ